MATDTPEATSQSDLLLILTTEQSNLQSARAGTIYEAGSRISGFLALLSGSIVALALVGQVSHLGMPFRIFAFVLLPAALFIGIATYERLIQVAAADLVYMEAIDRIRDSYVELKPGAGRFLMRSPHDDFSKMLHRRGHSWSVRLIWQNLVSSGGMILIIDGLVAGALAGLILDQPGLDLTLVLAGSILSGFVIMAALWLHARADFRAAERRLETYAPPSTIKPAEQPFDGAAELDAGILVKGRT
jgi:hypothetical protein